MCASKSDPKNPPKPHTDSTFLTDNLGDLFETHRRGGRSETGFLAGRGFNPAADIYESEDALNITLDVPGMVRDQIDLKIEGQRLTVSGSREFVRTHADEESVRLERGFGNFRRAFELPQDIDSEGVTARLEQGVLTVRIPRRSAGFTIEVEQAGADET